MRERDPSTEKRQFGRYLRRIREQRKLSLDAVEEMSLGYPERVTKSHLSRIENGQAVPTFPRMFALSRIYGVPIASVAERFETDLERDMRPADLESKSTDEILLEVERCGVAGRYRETLALVSAALERLAPENGGAAHDEVTVDLRLHEINCLIQLQRYESAKVECEELLTRSDLGDQQRLWTLLFFVTCSYRLQRFSVAVMALERVEKELDAHDYPPRARAMAETIRGPALYAMGRTKEAAGAFERALDAFRSLEDAYQTCKAQINLAQTLIDLDEIKKARASLREVLKATEKAGYDKLKAMALSHLVVVHHRAGELEAAESCALRSNSIARRRDYISVVFRNCYYLREIAAKRGDGAAVRSNERTLKAYLSRVEADMPEALQVRARLAGEER
jgi:tetratricopeptide (TPR) repeat protein